MKFKFDKNSTPNFGRFRLKDPKIFARLWTRHDLNDKGISYIVGTLPDGKYATQAIRFDRKVWTESKASKWWTKNKPRFTLKTKKNPNEPLKWYLTMFDITDIITPNEIRHDEKVLILDKAKSNKIYAELVGKYKDGDIYICYLQINRCKFLYGIIEVYSNKIEYHTFNNEIKEINKNIDVDSLNFKLYKQFIENL